MCVHRMIVIPKISAITQGAVGKIELTLVISIITALTIIPLSFSASFGIKKEITVILVGYSLTLIVLFIIHVMFAAVLFVKYTDHDEHGSLKSQMREGLLQSLSLYEPSRNGQLFDLIHKQYECCGVYGPLDWGTLLGKDATPKSCCSGITNGVCSISNAYKTGCLEVIFNDQQKHGWAFGYTFIILFLHEIVVSALCLSLLSSIM
ncbi:tetraspanin-9-like isoform X2 [Agrilus planipennis]|nr:tetraspanin-9-like isoform X2 [Agrilus planipennis]